MKVNPGEKYKIFYNKNNINNKVIHIRAIVDDYQIICRHWSRYKQRWIYTIENEYYFYLLNESDSISKIK